MPYITIKQPPKYQQISFDDILNGSIDISRLVTYNTSGTKTRYTKCLDPNFSRSYHFEDMIVKLEIFNTQYQELFNADRESLYETFFIPKKSGGLREINAPVPELKEALRNLKSIFENDMYALYHTSAYAYIKGRCTVDSIKKHQRNESKWFVKLDFSNFFGNTTEDFVFSMFSQIFPFSEIVKTSRGKEALQKALSLCFFKGGLPQGTPISPIITNIMMIPIDHQLCNKLKKFSITKKLGDNEKSISQSFVYTRYADDILISSRYDFDFRQIQDYVLEVLVNFNAPFSLKKEKTRYGSSAGRNWNLGVMLNKDNEITIGHQKKKVFKAMCNNYICDKKNGINWCLHDVQVFAGLISYYRMIEKEYIDYVLNHMNEKYGVNIEDMIKEDLR